MNQKNLWIALITLIVAIFVFAQVYILFAVTQVNNRLVQMETRFDKRFTELESRVNTRFTELESRINTRFTELETRFDKRFNLIETRLDALNQNYIKHLAHHLEK
ncbi:hypothetical protein C6502_22385 [Candidatus Poribacteria bacterium]|nr:MAG: hypothetical protein C6502_22385 [Candidatus Poribacteria bacterium]